MSSVKNPVKVEGSLDAIVDGVVHGWAWDPSRPLVRVPVEIYVDGKYLTTVVASHLREDLLAAGKGDGCCCFHADLPDDVFDNRMHTVAVTAFGSPVSLTGSPITGVIDASKRKGRPVPSGAASPHPRLMHRTRPEPVLSAAEIENFKSGADSPDTFDGLAVVIPTYNRGASLETSLRAWAACDRPCNVEFIVVDDGSTDDTPDRLARLEHEIPGLRWTRVNNGGPGAARNAGVEMTAMPLILFTGDDIRPATPAVLAHHLRAHRCFPSHNVGVLGKIVWPDVPGERLNFVMSHIQGMGEQQFGFYHLQPYSWLDWRFFYTSNVSIKRSVVGNWRADGFSGDFPLASFEDGELAYRMNRSLVGGFRILYAPAPVVTHHHSYSVREFIRRQINCGLMAKIFEARHPEAVPYLGTAGLIEALRQAGDSPAELVAEYQAVIEGIKAWAVTVERDHLLGSQNWHADLLAGTFHISFLQGRLLAHDDPGANYAAAYKYVVGVFKEMLSTAASFEALGKLLSLSAV